MKLFKTIVLAVLVLMSLAAGAAKLFQMPQEALFFQAVGLGSVSLILLGVIQITGGVLAVFSKTRLPGTTLMAVVFLVSAIMIFISGQVVFATVSLLPVLLAGFLMAGGRQ